MRVLLITDNFLPHAGGSRFYYYNIFRNFPNSEVVILTKKIPGARQFDAESGIRTFRISLPILRWKKIEWVITYSNLFFTALVISLRFRPDIIHCGEVMPSGFIGLILSKIFRIPYLVYIHNGEMLYTSFRFEKRLFFKVLSGAHRIIAACNFIRDYFKKLLPMKEITLVNPGIERDFGRISGFNPEKYKASLGLTGKRVILTVARLKERKGIDSVIKALPRIKERIENVVYIIVGEGPEKQALIDLAKEHKVLDDIIFIGEIRQEEVKKYFSICDIFIMPNREVSLGEVEGFGMVFLEAQSFGKPVIGGRSGGVADSIEHGVSGILVEPNDETHLERAILSLLADARYAQQMSVMAKKRAESWYSWDEIAKTVHEISLDTIRKKNDGKT